MATTRARTKIVATVGPACRSPAQLRALVEAGCDLFRLNLAHGTLAEHDATLAAVRDLERDLGRPIAILADLAGPKIRLGNLAVDPLRCDAEAEVRFVRGDTAHRPDELVASYDRLIDELQPGNRIVLADGTVSLVVEHVQPDVAQCRVVQPGEVRSRQGINLPGVKLTAPALDEVDQAAARWAAGAGVDLLGLSFVRGPDDVRQLKQLLAEHDSAARVVAKIEKPEALEQLDAIIAEAHAVMVARGDLGVEIDVARMPIVQKQIIAACRRHARPVIVATQMLDSMQHSRHPTRAEATDVANAILDGADACMLSGETAIGQYPREAVTMMNQIALATEESWRGRRPLPQPDGHSSRALRAVTAAVVTAAGQVAHDIEARLIVVASHSGATALALSQQRNYVPTLGVSDDEPTLRQMCLCWGVIPLPGAPTSDSTELIGYVSRWGQRDGCLAVGDHIVLVAGTGLGLGQHSVVAVHQVQ